MKKIDLTGQRFGKLTVVRELPARNADKRILWECRCDCGGVISRVGKGLKKTVKQGGVPSCGCYQQQISRDRNFKNLSGRKFGQLTVVEYAGSHAKEKSALWRCRCDCGKLTTVRGHFLRSGHTTSCGCRKREINEAVKDLNRTHGMSHTPEMHSYRGILQRCYNSNHPSYKDYGGRGIYVCDLWRESFENFYADMGPCPSSQHSIDRINNNGPYAPKNCRWATPLQQSNNRRGVIRVAHQGRNLTLREWSEETGIKPATLKWRLKNGWSIADALCTPVQ